MDYENLGTPLKETLEEFKAYVENLITYNKLVFVRGAGELSSYLILLVLMFGISGFVLLFLSFAFAGWFGQITGLGIGAGYLLVALFYIIFGILVFAYRNKLLFNPIRKFFGDMLFGDLDSSNTNFTFDSEKAHAENILEVHGKLTKQKETLNNRLKNLEKNLTISNIIQHVVGKAYGSIMTTSNIARFIYTLIRKFKWFTKRKKRKKESVEKDKGLKNSLKKR
jgi:hypothetical protein